MEAREIKETWSSQLNELVETLKNGGPSPEEFSLMGVIAIMDETLRELAHCPGHSDAVFATYYEVELYIEQEGIGH